MATEGGATTITSTMQAPLGSLPLQIPQSSGAGTINNMQVSVISDR